MWQMLSRPQTSGWPFYNKRRQRTGAGGAALVCVLGLCLQTRLQGPRLSFSTAGQEMGTTQGSDRAHLQLTVPGTEANMGSWFSREQAAVRGSVAACPPGAQPLPGRGYPLWLQD